MSQCNEVKPSEVRLLINSTKAWVNKIMSQDDIDDRKERLKALVSDANSTLNCLERDKLYALLTEYHEVFSLEDNERGETDLVQLTIDTGGAPPKRHLLGVYHLQHNKNWLTCCKPCRTVKSYNHLKVPGPVQWSSSGRRMDHLGSALTTGCSILSQRLIHSCFRGLMTSWIILGS